MPRHKHVLDRRFPSFATTLLTCLLVACGGCENSETSAPSSPTANAIADEGEDSVGSLKLDDETIPFTVDICANAGGGTYTLVGSATRADGKPVGITVRGVQGKNQVFIKIGVRDSADSQEWRSGTKSTTASQKGAVLTASGELVLLDSVMASTGETMTFSLSGPCVNPMDF